MATTEHDDERGTLQIRNLKRSVMRSMNSKAKELGIPLGLLQEHLWKAYLEKLEAQKVREIRI